MSESQTRLLIVEARFYEKIADEMAAGAVEAIEAAGAKYERIAVPGAFEIPAAILMAIRGRQLAPAEQRFDGYVALGCVIRGETTHYDYVCGESARGLQELAIRYAVPVGYGIITVENEAQAWARASREKKNKGADAANACLAMLAIRRSFGLQGL